MCQWVAWVKHFFWKCPYVSMRMLCTGTNAESWQARVTYSLLIVGNNELAYSSQIYILYFEKKRDTNNNNLLNKWGYTCKFEMLLACPRYCSIFGRGGGLSHLLMALILAPWLQYFISWHTNILFALYCIMLLIVSACWTYLNLKSPSIAASHFGWYNVLNGNLQR